MQKHVNLVDLVKSFPTNIYLQNLASIQERTSPIKFDHLAEKSESAVRSFEPESTKVGTTASTLLDALALETDAQDRLVVPSYVTGGGVFLCLLPKLERFLSKF